MYLQRGTFHNRFGNLKSVKCETICTCVMNQIPQRMEVFMKMVSCSDLEEIYWHELDALLS